jgi:integrase
MRLSEQHTIEWSQVHLQSNRRQIQLLDTKNGSQRTVTLTEEAVAALEVLRAKRTKKTDRVFVTRYGDPFYWRNDYVAAEQWSRNIVRDQYVHLVALHEQHVHFAKTWDNNLRLQGFAEAFTDKSILG